MRRADLREWMAGTKVSASARLVFAALYAHSNNAGGAYPSLPRLAVETGLARSTVHAAVSELERAGDVAVIREKGRVSTYTIHNPSDSRTGDPNATRPTVGRGWSDGRTGPVRPSDPKVLKKDGFKERAGPAKLSTRKKHR